MKRLLVLLFLLSSTVYGFDSRVIVKDGVAGFGGEPWRIGEHGAGSVIDYNEAIRYEGSVRIMSDNIADLDVAVPKYYQIVVPNGTTITAGITLSAVDGTMRMLLSPDETVGAAGTTITAVFNPSFVHAKTTVVKFYEDSNTTNATATYYDIGLAGTAAATNPSGSSSGDEVSLIHKLTLGAGTWIIKLLSLNNDVKGTIFLEYHEE